MTSLRSLTAALSLHPIARRLPLAFAPARLRQDLSAIQEDWWCGHLGPYHDGDWESVSLWAPRGDRREQRSFGGPFAATEALDCCPYFAEVMAAFPCPKNRVRLMRLRAGGQIHRHSDPLHQISHDLIRIHVPIVTSSQVRFLVHDRPLMMQPGEAWHVDVRFPHEVHNGWSQHRVHLVLDLMTNPAVSALLDRAESVGSGFLTGYYARHALPRPARRLLRIGN